MSLVKNLANMMKMGWSSLLDAAKASSLSIVDVILATDDGDGGDGGEADEIGAKGCRRGRR